MISLQIFCINKIDRPNPHERITHVGGKYPDGGRWKMTQQQAIAAIKAKTHAFFVEVRGDRVKVVVATSRYENEYLKTVADGDQPNNLLALAECPL